ncbi:hypothetical protein EV360DRAFT_82794 [Lentinula raphanica]|nr:hypothetical protein EV360DRAFT_82794 [Lentinula raphanica]
MADFAGEKPAVTPLSSVSSSIHYYLLASSLFNLQKNVFQDRPHHVKEDHPLTSIEQPHPTRIPHTLLDVLGASWTGTDSCPLSAFSSRYTTTRYSPNSSLPSSLRGKLYHRSITSSASTSTPPPLSPLSNSSSVQYQPMAFRGVIGFKGELHIAQCLPANSQAMTPTLAAFINLMRNIVDIYDHWTFKGRTSLVANGTLTAGPVNRDAPSKFNLRAD